MKNMRMFFENLALPSNRQLPTDGLKKCVENYLMPVIRQLPTGDLTDADLAAFFSIGFTHDMEIRFKLQTVRLEEQ